MPAHKAGALSSGLRVGDRLRSTRGFHPLTGMSLTGMKKHVRILEEAELITTEKRGRTRHCRLGPKRLDDVASWVASYQRSWEERYSRLDELIEQEKGRSS